MQAKTMDAVLPLVERDVERATILLESLDRRFSGLGTVFVVCPDRELRGIRQALARSVLAPRIRLTAETEMVPELAITPTLGGWYRQQLVKLAAFEWVETDVYLTLDSDVLCTRPVSAEDLAPDGRGLCHVIGRDLHPDWYSGSEAVLGMRARRRGVLHAVTPAVLHRRGVRALADHLDARARSGESGWDLRGVRRRWLLRRARTRIAHRSAEWRVSLAGSTPWTEYALYFTFLEATDRFEEFHVESSACIYDVERSIWRADRSRFGAWDTEACFDGSGPPWFVVVQSNAKIPPSSVRRRVERYLLRA